MNCSLPRDPERIAGFQTCRIADFQIGSAWKLRARWIRRQRAGLETRDTADLEIGATVRRSRQLRDARRSRRQRTHNRMANGAAPLTERLA